MSMSVVGSLAVLDEVFEGVVGVVGVCILLMEVLVLDEGNDVFEGGIDSGFAIYE